MTTDYLRWMAPSAAAVIVIGGAWALKTLDSRPSYEAVNPRATKTIVKSYPAPEVSIVAEQAPDNGDLTLDGQANGATDLVPTTHKRHSSRHHHKPKPKTDDEATELTRMIAKDDPTFARSPKSDTAGWKNWALDNKPADH